MNPIDAPTTRPILGLDEMVGEDEWGVTEGVLHMLSVSVAAMRYVLDNDRRSLSLFIRES
jgi:hypothetical protein